MKIGGIEESSRWFGVKQSSVDMPRTYRDTDIDTGVTDMDTNMDTNFWKKRDTDMNMDTNFERNRDTDVDMDTSWHRCPPNSTV